MKKPNLGILIKPVSSDCNMACAYCYYRPVEALYPDAKRPRMSLETFEQVCAQYLALEPREIKVGWQGGEPTLMGLDFFRDVVEVERRHTPPGGCFGNSLQTNGAVLDEEWCQFLARNQFLVGLSIDGPPELNTMRRFADGRPAYERTMRALHLLKEHEVEHNVLVVISRANVDHPREILQFLVENDCHYSQFIPCTEPTDEPGRVSEHSISAQQYADFMIAVFDAWIENDDPSYYIRRVDNWLHLFFGLPPECCEYRGDCSNLVTIEWNGDVYPCDFFVQKRYFMGNVRDLTLEQMLQGKAFRDFVQGSKEMPAVCADCTWLEMCHAGCFRHRVKLGIDPQAQPYLCEAKKRIFSHVFSTLRQVVDEPIRPELHAFLNRVGRDVAAGRHSPTEPPPAETPPARQSAPPAGRPSRNASCPCGSGKKFKHCCGRLASARRKR